MSMVFLNAEQILNTTANKYSLTEYVDDGLRTRFGQMIDSMNAQGAVAGWAMPAAVAQLSLLVRNRLEVERDWTRYPDIASEEIVQPIFALGSGRTGTSAMQNLLALGDGCRTPLTWERGYPSPPPGLNPESDLARMALENSHMRDLINVAPGTLLSHPYVDAGALMDVEDEDILVLDFHTLHPFHLNRVPTIPISFHNKVSGLAYALRFHKKFLQHLQWQKPTQRWVCKGTQHHFQVPAVWEVYPDALCVWTHRDPVAFIASVLGIVQHVYTPITGKVIRGDIVDELVEGMRVGYDNIFSGNWLNDERLIHIRFDDFVDDQVGTMRHIYEHGGMEFSQAYEARIRRWLADPSNKSDRHGKYSYSLAQFGLDEDQIREMFADYYEHFLM